MSAALAVGQLVEAAGALPAALPSPPQHTWYVGPFPIRAYALAILAGIAVALWLTRRRWVERGGEADDVLEIAFWAVPFGIVGGRLYHVFSTPDPYWGPNGDPVRALYVWEGGLGIWGAVALGAVGAYIGCRRQRVSFPAFADALAPGLLLAQAVGRLGNWFNQELFGAPTTLPWGLRVDDSVAAAAGYPPGTLFHPTFLYEMVWNIGAALLLIYLDRRFRLGHGRVFWLYVFVYTLGRVWIEMLRIDEAELVLGLRLNVWTSILVGVGALIAFIVVGRRHPGREETVSLDAPDEASTTGSEEPVEESTDDEDPSTTEDSDDSEESEQADAARPDPGR
ncbi:MULTISPECIES: prolipoprotein diacylglyceryl transferase [Cellulosimicrobium]|uniref:Phosphatidylglycerol--prolipoprotein diacylglyceryl transferase n=1 Tax=Cellulosimicrobium sp. ES-005 TaxID=3163031 RepID=A0AAU8G6E9_9MICO|nr:prolipoprotein diacylglyceryl transferase [Cellulosimicrobium cellulans]MCO7271981.1 prolipoprotein diacylglyceryl transferase [Cellulosimicrobium cellulans]